MKQLFKNFISPGINIPSIIILLFCTSSLFAQFSRRYSFNKNPYQSHYQRASAGLDHVIELKSGSLWSYGNNQYGQLGDGTNNNVSSAIQIGTASDWILIASGNYHNLAIKSNGTLWAWGRNTNGQLGNGTSTDSNVPVQVGTNANWISITAGATHSLGIQADGTLWAWGGNTNGGLGTGTTMQALSPVQVGSASNWVQVQAGYDHTLARRSDGTLWAWGLNSSGQLGDGTTNNILAPVQIHPAHNWTGISAGANHSLGLRNDGTLWAWGSNQDGQLGIGSTVNSNIPVQIGNSTEWSALCAGQNHSAALQVDGTLWFWGRNTNGQLGNGSTQFDSIPVQLGTRDNWVACVLGGDFSIGYCSDGSFWTWGNNSSGQLGDGSTTQRNSPVMLPMTHLNIVIYSSGMQRSASIRSDGSFWIFGMNQFGEIGDGSLADKFWPVRIGNSADWSNVLIHSHHTLALKSNGSLWGWGSNSNGQLGDGTFQDRLSPVQIGNGAKWRAVHSGNDFTFAIESTGRLWGWGMSNVHGNLGKGDSLGTYIPVPVDNSTDWISVSGGEIHSVGLKADGTIWAAGYNDDRRLGDGSNIERRTFIQIGTDTDWVCVSVGENFAIAVKANGTIWGWGRNDYGQIGDGSTTNRNIPVQIGSSSNWVNVYAGFDFSMGIQADGSLWGWGNNDFGNLGTGNNTDYHIPTLISSDSIHLLIDPGAIQSALIKTDRQNICTTGYGISGVLGNGLDTIIHNFACDVPLNTLSVDIETNSPVYSGDTLNFTAKEFPQGNYYWEGPNGFTSNSKSFFRSNSNCSMSGVYTVTLTYFSSTSTDTQSVYVYPAIGNNTITGAQTFCASGISSILSGASPSGGDGIYTYVWETSADLLTWNPSGISSQDFPSITLNDTLWVRRIVESLAHYDTSNVLLIDVRKLADLSAISASLDTVCMNHQTSVSVTGNLYSATDWEWYRDSCGGTLLGNGANLPFQTSVQVWLFVRGIGNGCIGPCDSIQITPSIPLGNNTLSGDQTLCGGTPSTILSGSTPTGGLIGFAYKWESSTDELNWSSTGITSQDYQSHIAMDTIYYRRLVGDVGGYCDISVSNSVRIEVRALADLPILSAPDTICVNTQTLLSILGDLNSATDWEWYYDICGGQLAGIGNSLPLQTLIPATLYARGVGNGCEGPCDSIHISLSFPIGDNIIIGAQTLLGPGLSAVLTGSLPTGGVTGFSYQWESSTDLIIWSYTGISTQDYPSHLVTDTAYYRRVVSDGGYCPTSVSNTEMIEVLSVVESLSDIHKNDFRLRVYPNPTEGTTSIGIIGLEGVAIDINIYDILGHAVSVPLRRNEGRTWELDFRGMSKGLYLLKVKAGTEVLIERVVVK